MKRFTAQNIFAAIAAFLAVLFFAEAGGTSGPGKNSEETEDDNKKS
jgi:hypothetical protein